jgi:hypothetical protein
MFLYISLGVLSGTYGEVGDGDGTTARPILAGNRLAWMRMVSALVWEQAPRRHCRVPMGMNEREALDTSTSERTVLHVSIQHPAGKTYSQSYIPAHATLGEFTHRMLEGIVRLTIQAGPRYNPPDACPKICGWNASAVCYVYGDTRTITPCTIWSGGK